MGFHYPVFFMLYVLFAVAIAFTMWSRWKRRRDLRALGEWRLLKKLIDSGSLIRRKRKEVLGLVGLAILIFSTTGPQFGTNLKEVKQRGVDVFIALDTSRSMLAEDISPSRLEKAKRSLGLLVRNLAGNRTGIIAFAKEAIVQCPLTIDTDAAQMFLEILDTNTIPLQGTSIGDAIRLALTSFPKEDKTGRAIVLLTDGEDHQSDPIGAAKEAKEAGVVIFTIGIGTPKGEVIKNRNDQGQITEFHKYKGEMVVSRLDDASLTKIAEITGGKYFRASSSDMEIDEIGSILNEFDKKEFATKTYERLQERYQFFVLLAFILLLVEFFYGEKSNQWLRIKSVLNAKFFSILTLALLWNYPAQADIKNHIRRGNDFLKKNDFAAARAEFESARIDAPEEPILPYNIGTVYYLEGNLEEAKKTYEQALSLAKHPQIKALINYNLGHLLFAMNEREQAIEKFKDCLRNNPADVDAKYNIEYIKAGHQPPPQPQKQPNKDDKGQGQEKKEQSANVDEGNEGKDQQKKEGDLSKENAEQILQMLQSQESEKIKSSKPVHAVQPKKNKNNDKAIGEDW